MIERKHLHTLESMLADKRVVGLGGVRGGGKSTLLRAIAGRVTDAGESLLYLDLESAADLAKLETPERLLRGLDARLVILDEIGRRPDLLSLAWRLVDGRRYRGGFLVATSEMPSRLAATVPGADLRRIDWLQSPPLGIDDVPVDGHDRLWLRGGLPGSYSATTDETSFALRDRWLGDLLERRLPATGLRFPPDRLRLLLAMLARSQGETWNASRLARGLGCSVPTVGRWLDALKVLFLVRSMPALRAETGKRLIAAPRVWIRDPGLACLLLGIDSLPELIASPHVAAIWAGWMIEQFIEKMPNSHGLGHYRTRGGAAIDLLTITPEGEVGRAVDFRYGGGGSRGFSTACADLGIEAGRRLVVTPDNLALLGTL